MKLFVDDVRPIPDGWAVARTVQEAIDLLKDNYFEEVSLDFVIGYDEKDNFSPVAHFIVSLPAEKRPKRVYIHTSSVSGALQLTKILEGSIEKIIRI